MLIQNVLYLMIWDGYNRLGEEAIVSFILKKENLRILSPQDGLFRRSGCLVPGGIGWEIVLGGQYCMPLLIRDTWVMKDLKNYKWIKECCIIMKGFSKDFQIHCSIGLFN